MIGQAIKKLILATLMLGLVACVSHTHDFVQSQVQDNLLREDWQSQIDTDPMKWNKHADNWLWFGTPNALERANRSAPYSAAMSTMMVRVPDFTRIQVNGDFEVQLDGRFQHNSVYLFGPNEELRQVVVEVKDHTLDIHLSPEVQDPKHVIVRIAIQNLQSLTHNGSGKVQGRFVRANPLSITSNGSGDIVLTGKINLRHVYQTGAGDVTILGAYSPSLFVDSKGSGSLNISGRVGIESITHSGSGNVNIIGADTNLLNINATGSGKIGIRGIANLRKVSASDYVKVYLYLAKSDSAYAYLYDKAYVGIAGQTTNLYIDARGSSTFAGRYLHSEDTYVRTRDWAHVNVTANNRAFAVANGNSSVYVLSWPNVLSPYVTDNAMVIPIQPPPETPAQELRLKKKKAKRMGTETYLP